MPTTVPAGLPRWPERKELGFSQPTAASAQAIMPSEPMPTSVPDVPQGHPLQGVSQDLPESMSASVPVISPGHTFHGAHCNSPAPNTFQLKPSYQRPSTDCPRAPSLCPLMILPTIQNHQAHTVYIGCSYTSPLLKGRGDSYFT